MSSNQTPDLLNLERRPVIILDDGDVTIPAPEMASLAAAACPDLKAWWLGTYNVVTTVVPYLQRQRASGVAGSVPDPLAGKCRVQPSQGVRCPNNADFTVVSFYMSPTQPVKILQKRISHYCSACLYLSQSFSLSTVMTPTFFKTAERSVEEINPNALYALKERTEFLQTVIQVITAHMEKHNPAALAEVLERLKTEDGNGIESEK